MTTATPTNPWGAGITKFGQLLSGLTQSFGHTLDQGTMVTAISKPPVPTGSKIANITAVSPSPLNEANGSPIYKISGRTYTALSQLSLSSYSSIDGAYQNRGTNCLATVFTMLADAIFRTSSTKVDVFVDESGINYPNNVGYYIDGYNKSPNFTKNFTIGNFSEPNPLLFSGKLVTLNNFPAIIGGTEPKAGGGGATYAHFMLAIGMINLSSDKEIIAFDPGTGTAVLISTSSNKVTWIYDKSPSLWLDISRSRLFSGKTVTDLQALGTEPSGAYTYDVTLQFQAKGFVAVVNLPN